MKNKLIFGVFALIVVLFVVFVFAPDSKGYESLPILQKTTVTFDTISRTELRSIFSGKIKTYAGTSLIVYYQPKYSLATQHFASVVLQFSVSKFYSDLTNWSSGGAARVPRKVSSDFEMILQVSQTPFSIGYASSGLIYQNVKEGLRILKVE